jgi:DNA-binding MarR family transcriptional regulator
VLVKPSAAAHLRTLHDSGSVTDEISEALQSVRGLVEGLSKSARGVEDQTGVTNAQLFLLQQIRANRHVTVNDLAALAMTTQSTVSIVLSRLERKRLVKRTRSPVDRRSVVLQLTETGKRLLRRAPRPATSEVLLALGRLTSQELRALSVGLRALGRELGLPLKPPSMLFETAGNGVPSRTAPKRRTRRPRG